MSVVPEGFNIFVVDLKYVASSQQLQEAFDDHIDFVKAHFASGMFIASGGKPSKDGGVILAVASTEYEISQAIKDDPYSRLGLADYSVTEFIPALMSPHFGK